MHQVKDSEGLPSCSKPTISYENLFNTIHRHTMNSFIEMSGRRIVLSFV